MYFTMCHKFCINILSYFVAMKMKRPLPVTHINIILSYNLLVYGEVMAKICQGNSELFLDVPERLKATIYVDVLCDYDIFQIIQTETVFVVLKTLCISFSHSSQSWIHGVFFDPITWE